jgi:hypothetical protein
MDEPVRSLYALQDRVCLHVRAADTLFYLTGGTAASRGYLHHRVSDDLYYFTNDNDDFRLWCARIVDRLLGDDQLRIEVLVREERFCRLMVFQGSQPLKVELINDVPSRVGEVREHPVLGRLDSPENIFSNKICAAMDRRAPRDLADIWGFARFMNLSLQDAISSAQSKAAGIFQPDLGRMLLSADEEDWKQVRWLDPPPLSEFLHDLHEPGESLIIHPGE